MRTCEVVGCDRPLMARGWCRMHYKRWQKHGDPGRAEAYRHPEGSRICEEPDCDRTDVEARGLCGLHYERQRLAEAKPCSIDGCDQPAKSYGWCQMHYFRYWRNGSPGEVERRQRLSLSPECEVDGCTKPDNGGGHCSMHKARMSRHGDVHTVIAVDDRKLRYGPDHPHWRETPSYMTAHSRTRRERGSASNHACVDCGNQAAQWAYDHNDPNQLYGTVPNCPSLMPYSAKPEHYQPMCVPCHKAFDLSRDQPLALF